ncbi:360_t:CDS:2 [Ambispora leptoticha]|uniref:360_t:CDS:1 n=1 Tax=Ambispora leptoticha TaxID=144679 RepID=A0A9N8ZPX0_9GLOM|nr:360_t:CDS:2 [Ambispora leptoticha]
MATTTITIPPAANLSSKQETAYELDEKESSAHELSDKKSPELAEKESSANELSDKKSPPAYTQPSETNFYEKTWKEKLAFIFSLRFILILLLGQLLSFCITSTSVSTQKLSEDYNANIPTTQNLLNYILLCVAFTGITIWKLGFRGWVDVVFTRGWKCLVDVEGNYFVVKAYNYTTLLSASLLDAWSIPVVVALSLIFLKVRYHLSQYVGVLVCLAGLALLVKTDLDTGRINNDTEGAPNIGKGDLFCIIGATCYGMSNVGEEYFVRKFPLWEVVGQMGFWGTIITAIQLSILERQELHDTDWNSGMVGLIIAYSIAMFVLYSFTPLLFQLSSATFFNLSLLTSDFYTLLIGLRVFNLQMARLYPVAFVTTILGCVIYYVYPATQPRIIKEPDLEIVNSPSVEKDREVV